MSCSSSHPGTGRYERGIFMSKTTRFRFKALTRRLLSMLLVLVLGFATASGALAAGGTKNTVSRSIAIVFDNSGSMYMQGNKAWCRATYAIEVFASMMQCPSSVIKMSQAIKCIYGSLSASCSISALSCCQPGTRTPSIGAPESGCTL